MEKGSLGRSLLSAGVRPGTLIGFADEMRVGPRGLVRRVWGVRGRKVVQPVYSPELNPAKRVFEEVRQWVEGRVYGRIEEKMEAVNAYLSKLESDPERARSLTGWEWIRKNVQGLREDYAASSS